MSEDERQAFPSGGNPIASAGFTLAELPASAASMATNEGVVSRQSVNTIPKTTSGMVLDLGTGGSLNVRG
jgi:hypothetical protein